MRTGAASEKMSNCWVISRLFIPVDARKVVSPKEAGAAPQPKKHNRDDPNTRASVSRYEIRPGFSFEHSPAGRPPVTPSHTQTQKRKRTMKER